MSQTKSTSHVVAREIPGNLIEILAAKGITLSNTEVEIEVEATGSVYFGSNNYDDPTTCDDIFAVALGAVELVTDDGAPTGVFFYSKGESVGLTSKEEDAISESLLEKAYDDAATPEFAE